MTNSQFQSAVLYFLTAIVKVSSLSYLPPDMRAKQHQAVIADLEKYLNEVGNG